jgi:predicted AlkP superfamily phosphohydrolase/phosphomutase
MEVTRLRKDTAIFLGKKYNWDFLMVQFQKTDAVFHDFVNEKHILTFYKFIDQCIRELVEALAADATIFLVSDHGMGKWDYIFYVNSWLRKEGYLQTKGLETHRSSLELEKERLTGADALSIRHRLFNSLMNCLIRMGISGERVGSFLSSLHMDFLKSLIPPSLIAKIPRVAIDEESSQAYCPSSTSFGLQIKLQNRDSYQGFRNHLIEKLRTISGPKGDAVFDSVMPREEYYHGPYIDSAPDILLVPKEMSCVVSDSVFDKHFLARKNNSHRINGLFTAAGHDIANSGYLGTVLSIFDVAPTILHIMGLPVPDDMDGTVLKELFKEDSEPAQRTVEYKATGPERKRVRDRVTRLKIRGKI